LFRSLPPEEANFFLFSGTYCGYSE